MPKKSAPIAVLADANILVKDMVAWTFYDLHAAKLIEFHWTPEIEAEYIEHRGRRQYEAGRAMDHGKGMAWASGRMEVIKKYLVKKPTPAGWVEDQTLAALRQDKSLASVSQLKDQDDVHVAMAAIHLSRSIGRPAVLVTENIDDLDPNVLKNFNVNVMHPGDLLELLHNKHSNAVEDSLLKTAKDCIEPKVSPADMLWSVMSRDQFWNVDLARKLSKAWGISMPSQGRGRAR